MNITHALSILVLLIIRTNEYYIVDQIVLIIRTNEYYYIVDRIIRTINEYYTRPQYISASYN